MRERLQTLLRAAPRRPALAAALISAAFAFSGIFQHDLWAPDEPRDAQMAKEMLERGFPALPTLGGEPFLEKPPLFFWAAAAAFRLFGASDGVARLPSALASVATGLVAFGIARKIGGRAAGVLAALVLATMSEFWSTSHKALNDVLLTTFVAGGHLAFLAAWDRFRAGRPTLAAFAAAGLCCGLGFLTKGVVAPYLLAGPVVLALAALREWRFLGRVAVAGGIACVLGIVVVAGPWVLALWNGPDGPAHVRHCLWDQTVARSAGGPEAIGAHAKGPLFYLPALPGTLFPWTLALPALWLGRSLRGPRFRRAALVAALFCAGVLLLSLPSGKRDLYLCPLLPAAAAVLATWLARCSANRKADRLTAAATLGTLGAVALAGAVAAGLVAADRLRLRETVSAVAEAVGSSLVLGFAAAAALGGVLLLLAARGALDPVRPRLGARLAAGVGAVFLVAHVAGRPVMNPGKSLREGSSALASAVPADEPFLAFEPDELTVATVEWYSGRRVVRVLRREASQRLQSGPGRHLAVGEKRERGVPQDLRASLRPVATIRHSAGRPVTVYAFEPPPGTGR